MFVSSIFRLPGAGGRGRINQRWTTRSWAAAYAITMTRTSFTKQRANATYTGLFVTSRACWATPQRSFTPCWMSNQTLMSKEQPRMDWTADSIIRAHSQDLYMICLLQLGIDSQDTSLWRRALRNNAQRHKRQTKPVVSPFQKKIILLVFGFVNSLFKILP